jgi:hypothetical protein
MAHPEIEETPRKDTLDDEELWSWVTSNNENATTTNGTLKRMMTI